MMLYTTRPFQISQVLLCVSGFSPIQFITCRHHCSVAKSFPTLTTMNCIMSGCPVLHYLPEFAQTHIHWVSDAIQPSLPLSSPSPPAYNLSKHQVFPNELALHIRWPKFWSLSSASVLPVNIQGLFPLGLTDLLAVQGTLKSLPQHQSLKASVLQCSAFFMVQLSIHTWLPEKA